MHSTSVPTLSTSSYHFNPHLNLEVHAGEEAFQYKNLNDAVLPQRSSKFPPYVLKRKEQTFQNNEHAFKCTTKKTILTKNISQLEETPYVKKSSEPSWKRFLRTIGILSPDLERSFPVGTIIEGKITDLRHDGVHVKIDKKVHGFLPISELSWLEPTRMIHLSQIPSVGQNLKLKVIGANNKKQLLSLSLRQLESSPWSKIKSNYPEGYQTIGVVRNVTDAEAIIELRENYILGERLFGFLRRGELSWECGEYQANDVLKVGQAMTVQVIRIDEDRERIELSVDQSQLVYPRPNPDCLRRFGPLQLPGRPVKFSQKSD